MNGSPRLRRLQTDYELVKTEFAGHKHIVVEPLAGMPPERYRVTYRVKGLALDRKSSQPVVVEKHVAEIYLHSGYPREKPKCELKTPIFHPNFGDYICIGDHWSAGETLADIIVKIGEMIQYRDYNPKSPLNVKAARWSIENRSHLPVGNVDLYQPEPEIRIGGAGNDEVEIVFAAKRKPDLDDFEINLK